MNLSEFVECEMEQILAEWEDQVRELIPESEGVDFAHLRDDAERILTLIARDLDVLPSQFPADAIELTLAQRISEIHALRTSVLGLYADAQSTGDLEELKRFNETLDRALVDATPTPVGAELPLITPNVALGGGTLEPEPAEEEPAGPPSH